jgi:uncharacterized membrane protein YqgA involved in biofilm formation
MLGVFTVFYGLRLTWLSINGSFLQVLGQIGVMILALMLGRLLGKLLRLQQFSNYLGRLARDRITEASTDEPNRFANGFATCTMLFCAAPLAFLGAVQDGLSSYFFPLAVKGVMEGLAIYGFVSIFGWGVTLSALPVLALQGTISLVCAHLLKPFLEAHALIDPINAVGGMLVFSVALVILGLKKVELADYLPSLVAAPVLAALFR